MQRGLVMRGNGLDAVSCREAGMRRLSSLLIRRRKGQERERLPSITKAPLLIHRILSIQVYGLLVWEIKSLHYWLLN